MADFNKFIKGFEEPKEEQPKPSKDPMPYGMKRRMEDEVSVHNGQQPKGNQQMPKKDYSYLDDGELYAQINLAENEEEYQDLVAEKERRWQESQKNNTQPKEAPKAEPKPLFDEYKLSTKEGIEEARKFLGEKGIKDPYSLNNEQFNALADEAAKKYGIDRELAQEFLVAPYDEKEAVKPQPKQGSFNEVFGEEPKNYVVWYAEDENGHAYPVEVEDNEIAKQEMLEQLKDAGIKKVYGGATNWGGTDILYDREKEGE